MTRTATQIVALLAAVAAALAFCAATPDRADAKLPKQLKTYVKDVPASSAMPAFRTRPVSVKTWDRWLDRAERVARRAFPNSRKCRNLEVAAVEFFDWRLFAQGLGGYWRNGSKRDERACLIVVNRDHYRYWTWGLLCKIVAHERGHLLGRKHTTKDERDLMYFAENMRPYAGCNR